MIKFKHQETGSVISEATYLRLSPYNQIDYEPFEDDGIVDFAISAAIGAATDSALLGGLLGGSLTGGIIGDLFDGDLFD